MTALLENKVVNVIPYYASVGLNTFPDYPMASNGGVFPLF